MAAHNDHDHGSAEYREGARAFKRAHKAHDEEDWNESIRLWKESAELGYKVGTSYYNAACGYARMGDARSAVDWLEKSLDEDFDMRSLLRSDGDLDPIRRDPVFKDFLASLEDRGIMRGGDRRLEKAQDAYEYLQETNSDDAKRWYKVGSNLLGMREYDAAVDALERAAELSPDKNANANYNLACAYALSGDESAALRYLETAVLNGFDSEERFRNDSDLDSIRGTARFEELNELREVLSLDRFHSGWGDWGSNYSKRRWAPAIEEYQEFVRESPNIGRAWSNLGWALHHSYRHAEAREAFERQLDLGYKPGIATYNIGCTYAMEGNDDQAMEWVQRSVDMGSTNAHQILSDEDLKTLRDHPGFRDLLESAGGFEHWEDTEGWSLDRMIDRIGSGIRHHLHNFNHDDDHDPADHLDRKDRAERPEDVVY